MKKSIKYAGIAAATLLAVAPVAAPVVSTTAQAAVTSVATDQSKQNNAVTAFGNQFGEDTAVNVMKKVNAGDKITLGTQKLSEFAGNNGALIKTPATLDSMNDLIGSDATVAVSAKYGSTSINQDDLTKILNDKTYPAVEFTITLNYNNLNDQAVSKTYTVKATRTTDDNNANELKTVNAKFTTPVSVALDSTTTSTQLTATTDIKLTDQNGDGVVAGTVTPSAKYYNTYADAMNDNGTSVVTGSKFTKAGTYYQAISFTAGEGSSLATFISNYTQDPSSYTVYVNGAKASAGYDFKPSSDNTTLTFVRAINVSNTTDQWTTTDTTGVVTTKSASKYYTLKNDDNVTIANRALGANTPWRTDKVRTNQDGVKQYRVATGEWIDADNVVYSNGNNNNSNNGSGLTDIKTVSGVATLTKAKGYFMALFNDEGKAYDNKYLGSPSAWRVDRTAKGADGKTYYRVATSEWLQAGEGVSFK